MKVIPETPRAHQNSISTLLFSLVIKTNDLSP